MKRRVECAAALLESIGEPVVTAETLQRAVELLRNNSYTAAIFDDHLVENAPHEFEDVIEQLGAAIAIQANFAISGTERLVRDVRMAMHRRMHDEAAARQAAARTLHGELSSTLTTLLLDCELALVMSGLPAAAAERLVSVHDAARKLRAQLEANEKLM